MLRHADVWRAIDRLAEEHGLSVSALARRSGLDPTTFNRSKRIGIGGKLRWPSTESVSKVLASTGAGVTEFVGYITEADDTGVFRNIPLIGLAQAGDEGFFDDAGYPAGAGWDEIPFPGFGDPHAYAVEINGDSMEPVFRDGDIAIVSPQASIRRGDRVVVKTKEGEILAKELRRRSARRIDLASLNPEHGDREVEAADVEWIARIVWASQ
ncbi:MAG: S24 family peptidase [Rhodospirillales bacterium]